MKSILFDVDGVFLSEERCFDVSALTIDELLYSKEFIGLNSNVDYLQISDEDIREIRTRIFDHDKILNQLKSLGMNSNWDMLFIVFSVYLIEILKQFSVQEVEEALEALEHSENSFNMLSQKLNTDIELNTAPVYQFLEHVGSGKEQIYAGLEDYAQKELQILDSKCFKLKSPLWHLTQSIYQEWYLGSQLFEKVENKQPRTQFKTGFIYEEILLRPLEEIKYLLKDLSEAGFQLAIATGRPRTETLVPFESFGLKAYFEDNHIVTASEVLEAENQFPSSAPLGKPNPFCYIATLFGNQIEEYSNYISNQDNRVNREEVFIVGDSLADLLCAKKIGATFIGTLTGLKGQLAKSELEDYDADYIINHIGELRDILL